MGDAFDDVIAATRIWLERAVIGLNLCPFARAVHAQGQVRFAVSAAASEEELLGDLGEALCDLRDTPPEAVETTLLIHPRVLADFLAYNDFLDRAEALLEDLGLAGEIQIASFHPAYRFADAAPDAIENYTNRSPYPMLHLLRERSVARAVAAFPDTTAIFERNIETLRRLGEDGWQGLFASRLPQSPRRRKR